MKKKLTQIFNIFVVCLLLTFIQCTTDSKTVEETVTEIVNTDEISQLSNFISNSTGIDLQKIAFDSKKNIFVIDADIHMSLKDAREHYNKSISKNTNKTAQRSYTYLMTPINSSSIQVYISPDVPSDWQIAINQAITNWNNINSSITISLVNAPTLTSINIGIYYDAATSTVAYASLPNAAGESGKLIQINTKYNSLTANQKVFAITHEMGHNFGLTHTDVSSYSLIPCTPVSDSASIMNSIVSTWTNYSTHDNIAISTLYPVVVGTKKLYRYFFQNSSDHFYTTNPCELSGGVFEKDAGYLYTTNVPGTVPLYRYYSSYYSDHYYTINMQSYSRFVYEKIEGYLYTTPQPGTTPLYRYWKGGSNYDHLYTTNWNELGQGASSYAYEGIVGYVIKK